jgi:hypothetical protein
LDRRIISAVCGETAVNFIGQNVKLDQKHLESFEMWCWRRMEKISWTDHVRNDEVLL